MGFACSLWGSLELLLLLILLLVGLDGGGRDAGIDVDVDAFSMAGWSHYFFLLVFKNKIMIGWSISIY